MGQGIGRTHAEQGVEPGGERLSRLPHGAQEGGPDRRPQHQRRQRAQPQRHAKGPGQRPPSARDQRMHAQRDAQVRLDHQQAQCQPRPRPAMARAQRIEPHQPRDPESILPDGRGDIDRRQQRQQHRPGLRPRQPRQHIDIKPEARQHEGDKGRPARQPRQQRHDQVIGRRIGPGHEAFVPDDGALDARHFRQVIGGFGPALAYQLARDVEGVEIDQDPACAQFRQGAAEMHDQPAQGQNQGHRARATPETETILHAPHANRALAGRQAAQRLCL